MLRRCMFGKIWVGPIVVAATMLLLSTVCDPTQAAAEENVDQSPKLMFDFVSTSEPYEVFGNVWYIYANGVIDEDAPHRLAAEIAKRQIPNRSFIYFDSPGGNLTAGMELGRLIRARRFTTFIGTKRSEPIDETGKAIAKAIGLKFEEDPNYFRHMALFETRPGICMSACALTFLGGPFRFLPDGSIYGVHRFYSNHPDTLDSDSTQIISASVVRYIQDMGVDPQLFTDMTTAGRDDINILSASRLIALHVVNNGKSPTVWSVESTGYGIYLKGQRDTVWGLGKLLLRCGSQKAPLIATAIFDPWGRQEEIVAMPVTLFYIDGTPTRIPQESVMGPLLNNGWINIAFRLNPKMIAKLKSSKSVGLAVQKTLRAGMFAGFDDMDFSNGAEKLTGLLTTCH